MDIVQIARPVPRTTPRDCKEPLTVWRTESTAAPFCLPTPI